jgi:hypothetical protein
VQQRLAVPVHGVPFPLAADADQVEMLHARLAGDTGEDIPVVVAGDRHGFDPGGSETFQAEGDGTKCLVVLAVLVDQVAADGQHIDVLGNGPFDHVRPGIGCSVRHPRCARLASNVDIAGTQNSNRHGKSPTHEMVLGSR